MDGFWEGAERDVHTHRFLGSHLEGLSAILCAARRVVTQVVNGSYFMRCVVGCMTGQLRVLGIGGGSSHVGETYKLKSL